MIEQNMPSLSHVAPCLILRPFLLPSRRAFHIQPTHLCRQQSQQQQQKQQPEKDDYYSLILSSPLPSSTSSTTATPTAAKKQKTEEITRGIVFGSRLAGPAARQREGWAQERPPEPDNCCMSGCVNCVWDAYREEVEVWAARQKVRDARVGKVEDNEEGEELFEGLPVGIREFMALEKKLRNKSEQKGAGDP